MYLVASKITKRCDFWKKIIVKELQKKVLVVISLVYF